MKRFEFLSQEDYDPAEELEPAKKLSEEESEPILEKDVTPPHGRKAFIEMSRRNELDESDIAKDPQLAEDLEKIIETLPTERQKEVVRQYYFQGKKSTEIAEDLGISPSRMHQIERKARRLLRQPDRMKHLEGFELLTLSRDRYYHVLGELINNCINDPKIKKNKEIRKILRTIDYFSWASPHKDYLCKLDSSVFNQIFDAMKEIIDKEEYDDQDIAGLKNIAERLKQEIEKVKGVI